MAAISKFRWLTIFFEEIDFDEYIDQFWCLYHHLHDCLTYLPHYNWKSHIISPVPTGRHMQLSLVSVYYVAVRTIVLSLHGSKLSRPVIIHDIIHSLMCMPSRPTPHCGFSGVSPDGNCAYVH